MTPSNCTGSCRPLSRTALRFAPRECLELFSSFRRTTRHQGDPAPELRLKDEAPMRTTSPTLRPAS